MTQPTTTPPGRLRPGEFAARFRESSRVLWCVAAGVLGDRTLAEDVLQEAAMTALSKLDRFEPGTSFAAWMSQTVRFVALNHKRKQQRRLRVLHEQGDDPMLTRRSAPGGVPAIDDELAEALQTLGETPRTCLLLKIVLELEYGEIADVLGIPAGTAMSHVSRARAKLKKHLGDRAAGPSLQEAR